MKKKLAILLSGRGSNFEAIARAIETGKLNAEISIVISNRPGARGLDRAKEMGLEVLCLPSRGVARKEYDARLVEELKRHNPDLICLAGFMRLLTPVFVEAFRGRILNIHPSLLPAFPGLDAQRQALEHGVRFTGCTVHFVDEGLDSGPIIVQAAVPVRDDDTVESLSARILEAEHAAYPRAIALVLSGEYRIEGRRMVRLKEK
jgi:phosphoribosylglycinamide formyltransferase-1